MRMTRLAVATTVAGLITLFSATGAQAYGDEPVLTPDSGSTTVEAEPGGPFSLSGDFGGAEVESYVADLLGETVGSGTNTTTWEVNGTAPEEDGEYDIVFTIETADEVAPSASGLSSGFTPVSATYTKVITLVVGDGEAGSGGAGSGDSGSQSGELPDTGGSNLLLVAGGAALVLGGAGLLVARRRSS